MSKEIKFRAWDKQNKNMEEVDLLGSNVLHIKNSEWENIEDFEVMQYTGLKDKNGVEIYEGDIIREQSKRLDKYFVVEWLDRIGSYSFQPVDKEAKSWPCFNFGSAKNLEIVGNIYKNKELLEGSK
ncbi:YopX family protein [Clostridium luticellarii]|uniref:YopX protein n=1 Tax=Clostridium luticellarii TaxID=1691940 RepID=A0A2T0BNX2_9CLOT|nr:YopX family protein [Clostridium luticellarii]PRR85545.1 YopX protein [Clostridium luticellarii]